MAAGINFTGDYRTTALPSLVPGGWYIGFACKSCGAHFAIMNALTEPSSLEIGGPATFTVACPNCGAESAYSGGDLTQFQAAQGGASSTA